MTEAELKRIVLDMAKAGGWLVFHMPASTIRGSQGRGYPDLTLARYGEVLWLELKQENAAVRPEQMAWGSALPDLRWHVIRPSSLNLVARLLA